MLSVIIPTFNEIKSNYLEDILKSLAGLELETIVVDSFSNDSTLEILKKYNVKIFQVNTTSRAKRYNIGIQNASGDMILLHHPRSLLSKKAIKHLLKHQQSLDWGAFTHKFDFFHPLLSMTSWYSNFIRGDLRHIYYLDHCIFAKKNLLESVGLIDEVDIFEDTLICKKLKKLCRPKRLKYNSITSSIRFRKNGILKQVLINQKMKLLYFMNKNHKELNKEYDNLNLNSDYERD